MNKIDCSFPNRAIPYLLKYAGMYKGHIFLSFLLILLGAAVSNFGNWFFAQIIEVIKGGVSEASLKTALMFVLLMFICSVLNVFILKIAILYRQKYVYFPISARINDDALAYIQGHSYNYITSAQTGSLSAKMDQIAGVQPIFSMIMVGSWSIISEITIKTGILLTINVELGLLFLLCCVLSYLYNTLINKRAEHLSKMSNKIEALYGGWLVDIVANLRVVKQFNQLSWEKNRLFVLLKQEFRIKKKELGEGLRTYTYVGVFINLCSMAIITFAVYLWSQGKIGVGDIVFVILTLTSGLNYLIELHDIIRRLRNALASIDEGLKPFAVSHEITDVPDAKELKINGGEIEFKDVSFSYTGRKKIFNKFNLHIKPREKIGIVGVSGSGKTTLINLLQRAYEPSSGQILIDGQNIAAVTQSGLHQNISLIPQETTLFHRSIKDNIAFGNLNASEQEVVAAAQKAHADEFIENLPDQYETQVGDRGCKLSGGEKQRIAIARAVLKSSPVLILDEATSSLDSESEYLISQGISKLIAGKTVIAIAHRLSTLKEMDRIVVLEKGKIVEEGSFAELSRKKGGKFYHFCEFQKLKEKHSGGQK